LAPDDPDVLNNLGHTLQLAGRPLKALEVYRTLIASHPDHQAAHFGLSCLFATLGQVENAKQATRNAIRLRPVVTHGGLGAAGALLILTSMEDHYFDLLRGRLRTKNTNNATTHLERSAWVRHTAYLNEDFLDLVVPRLPAFDVVYNAITEPENCPQSLADAHRFTSGLTCPVINPPDRVALTTRDQNYRRLHDIPGLVYPKTARANLGPAPLAQLRAIMEDEGFRYPVIVRRAGTHGGNTAVKVDDDAALAAAADGYAGRTAFVIQFVDCRDRRGLFRKLRTIAVDGRIMPAGLYFDDDWNTHSAHGRAFMAEQPWTQEEERHFQRDPRSYLGERGWQALHEIHRRIGLDYYGADFAVLESGELVAFEVNAAMYHGTKFVERFPYLEEPFQRLTDAIRALFESRLRQARETTA
jgi:hypothetical protein